MNPKEYQLAFPEFSKRLLLYLFLSIMSLIYIAPVLFMIVSSFKPDTRVLSDGNSLLAFIPIEASLQNYHDVFRG